MYKFLLILILLFASFYAVDANAQLNTRMSAKAHLMLPETDMLNGFNEWNRSWHVSFAIRPSLKLGKVSVQTGYEANFQVNRTLFNSDGFVTNEGHIGLGALYEVASNLHAGVLYRRFMRFNNINNTTIHNAVVQSIVESDADGKFYYNQFGPALFYNKGLLKAELFIDAPVDIEPFRLIPNKDEESPHVALAFLNLEFFSGYLFVVKFDWTLHSPAGKWSDVMPYKYGSGAVTLRFLNFYEGGFKREFSPVGDDSRNNYLFLGIRFSK